MITTTYLRESSRFGVAAENTNHIILKMYYEAMQRKSFEAHTKITNEIVIECCPRKRYELARYKGDVNLINHDSNAINRDIRDSCGTLNRI